ncbi:homocysteine S-methyltransferase [Candidatus Gracilibacteria bacterium]|nr:homocysteine S-methyltransferase [Candidatus Gracilibacteria bacterium]
MVNFDYFFQSQPAVILDGALATELERRGCDLRDPLWSARMLVEQPALIRAVHADYFAAGSDCAITASYQASLPGFAQRGIAEVEALALIRRSVALAQEARDAFWAEPVNREGRAYPFIAGSVGPYGAYLADGSEYSGNYDLRPASLIAFHRPRIAALVEAGVDILACETIPALAEAEALLQVLAEFPQIKAWISFSAHDGTFTCHGEPITACAALLDRHPQVAAIGVNCTAPQYIPSLTRSMRSVTNKPIVVYPNSGETYRATDNSWHGTAACEDFAAQARTWFEAGARLIGGCCRTTPEHIRALRAVHSSA